MSQIVASYALDAFIIVNLLVELSSFVVVSDLFQKETTLARMILLTFVALGQRLFGFAVGENVSKPIASEAYILLWTPILFVAWWQTKNAEILLWTDCPVVAHFVAVKTDDIVFVVSEALISFGDVGFVFSFISLFGAKLLLLFQLSESLLSLLGIFIELLKFGYEIGVSGFVLELAARDGVLEKHFTPLFFPAFSSDGLHTRRYCQDIWHIQLG